MPHHLPTWLVLVLLLRLRLALLRRLFCVAKPALPTAYGHPVKPPRLLRPRTPDDCPACRDEMCAPSGVPTVPPLRPWREVKSRLGTPKRIRTDGFAFPNPDCQYYGITDSRTHALVGYGDHGQTEPIQDLFCQACRHKFTVRRDTPLYRLKTSAARVALVLTALAEGLSVAGAAHSFEHTDATITRWLQRAGGHAERMQGRLFRNLPLLQVQLDELRTTLRDKGHEVWIWLALDARTKVIAGVQFGPRTQVPAHALIHTVVQVLAPGGVPLFTSDDLDWYGYALTAHFGQWVQAAGTKKRQWQVQAELLYGQLKKSYRRRKLVKTERRMRWGTLAAFQANLKAEGRSQMLNTALIERVNLTIRRGITALQRRNINARQRATVRAVQRHVGRASGRAVEQSVLVHPETTQATRICLTA